MSEPTLQVGHRRVGSYRVSLVDHFADRALPEQSERNSL